MPVPDSSLPSSPQTRAVQRVRAATAALAGAVLAWFYLVPVACGVIAHAGALALLVWLLPTVGALATGVWAWHSAFGCRLVGCCTLLTAPLMLFLLWIARLVFVHPPLAVTILLPVGVAAVGVLAFLAGSDSLDRKYWPGRRKRRQA